MKSARSTARSHNRITTEAQMIRKREKEYDHQVKWGNQVQYYKAWEKNNNKFEEWTSPRYFEENNKMIDSIRKDRDKKELLEKRREKLRKLLMDEEKSFEIELMVKNRDKYLTPRSKPDDIPTELLKEVNLGIKLEEEERRKKEAELKLYHQWRSNNPVLREHERARTVKNMKLAWLDQQIQKRMEREQAEEDCKRIMQERQKLMEESKVREEQLKKETEEKNKMLQEELQKQIEDLQIKQKESDDLRKLEEEEIRNRIKLAELEEKQKLEEKRRVDREYALYNIRQYKLRLKQKALDIQESLKFEKDLIEQLIDSQVAEQIEDETKKREIKQTMSEFLKFARDQQDLEKQRQKYLDFVFDSEAKSMFEKQREIWEGEQTARANLIRDMLASIKSQVSEKIEKNKEQQKRIIEERQEMLKNLEECDEKMRINKESEERKRNAWKRDIDKQIREKVVRKREAQLLEQSKIDLELEAVRKEEERLKQEILKLQRRQMPVRPTRNKIFF